MTMNFMIYVLGLTGYFICGFAFHMGGVGLVGVPNLGGLAVLNHEITIPLGGIDWGLIGWKGFFLSDGTYDVGVVVMFLFQMVFMDTTATIPTGAMAERWKWSAFCIYGLFISTIVYPIFGNWAWGGGWLSQLGKVGLGSGYLDFAGSGVVHAIGGWSALAGAMVLGPRLGKYNKDGIGQPHRRPQSGPRSAGLLHPGLRLVRLQPGLHAGRLGQRQPAHRYGRRVDDARFGVGGNRGHGATRGSFTRSQIRP